MKKNYYIEFIVKNGNNSGDVGRNTGYVFLDGRYHEIIFAKLIHSTLSEATRRYTKRQKAIWKDVERRFGVLRTRFQIMETSSRLYFIADMVRMSEGDVRLHNVMLRL